MANTRAQMDSLVSSNLGTAVGTVTAAEHREVETAMLEYVSGQVLAAGNTTNFDPNITNNTVPLGITLPNTEYIIVGHFVSNGPDWGADNDTVWDIVGKTPSSFTISTYEWNGGYQQVSFNWIAIATPGNSYSNTP